LKILVVFDHPRRDSFCGAVLDAFAAGLAVAGHQPEIADLYREGFDPRMPHADEPDWDDPAKRYSDAVLAEQARMTRNEALAFVFPVWWWSVPAMTKGWIDRVWNNGWAYGAAKLPHAGALLIGTGSSDAACRESLSADQCRPATASSVITAKRAPGKRSASRIPASAISERPMRMS